MSPSWLQTLFQKWCATRGNRLLPAKRAFDYSWEELLDEAGLRVVEDRRAAERDVRSLHKLGRLIVKTHKYRHHLIEKVIVPLESEAWLMSEFGHIPATQLHQQSLAVIQGLLHLPHPLYPELWKSWCDLVQKTFQQGKNLQPLSWKDPQKLGDLMKLVHSFTSIPWSENTAVRDASSQLGLRTSKDLEEAQARLEACLTTFFARPTTLESCGILLAEPKVEVAGKLTLHYADSPSQPMEEMRGPYSLSLFPDLQRAVSITTSATRLLTVENSKTTLPALAAKNPDADTLLINCSFPNAAVIRLMELLPVNLPVYHFGDTDPSGFLILSTLRRKTGRRVHPFLMEYQRSAEAVPFTEHDRKILPNLLTNPCLTDVRPAIEKMMHHQDKGQYEQEKLGRPDLDGWPFYTRFTAAPTVSSQPVPPL